MRGSARNRFRAAVGRRIRARLGIASLWARVERGERELEGLTKRVAEAERPAERIAIAERDLGIDLTPFLAEVARRLPTVERELEVWRFMAWLERVRPASNRLVSVVTATRNRASVLERCIRSVLAQAHTRFELVIVDDGSDDATPDLLSRQTDSRVRSFRVEHAGVCAARNHGLEQAAGSVVTYLDDDNIMDPLWLMAVAWVYDQHPGTDVLYGARIMDRGDVVHDPEREENAKDDKPQLPLLQFYPFDRATLNKVNLADTNVIAHRRDHPEARFDEELSVYGDWDLMLRLTRETRPFELPAIACTYSTGAVDRLSSRDSDALRDERARVTAKHRTVSPPLR